MQVSSSFSSAVSRISRILFVLLLVAGSVALVGSNKSPYTPRDKAYWADRALVDFVNPGLNITINSAAISSAGAISVTYTLTDATGLPLDASGTTTPGAITLAYVAAYIPAGQEQYVALTTASATGAALGTITRPDFELPAFGTGTPPTSLGSGQYKYTFTGTAPSGFDPTTTYTVAVDGNRNLTSFNLGTNYAGATFNFVPNGSKVTLTRDVIRTQSCNKCHYQLAFHGGYASGMPMCVMCHQPQNADPVTGNTLDLKVFAHKLHMGSQLPSVLGYTSGTTTVAPAPYEIIGYMNSVNDFSTVIDPANPQRCEVCHDQTTGAAQAKAFMTEPTRAACGACHDNVNFATGANHPGGFQADDTECANCHIPQGETPFDASILGAHVVATDTAALYPPNPDTLIAGLQLAITGVTNTSAGQSPTVAFTVQDNSKNNIALSQTLHPAIHYGWSHYRLRLHRFRSRYDSRLCDGKRLEGDLQFQRCLHIHLHQRNPGSRYRNVLHRRRRAHDRDGVGRHHLVAERFGRRQPNPVVNFSVDGSPVTPRRTVVALGNCNGCHVSLSLHGNLRNNTEYCVFCHNPSNTDVSQRVNATVAADKALPNQGINFALMVHRIHDGVNAAINPGGPPKEPYVIVGFGGSHNDFSGVLFPVMNGEGTATDMQDCQICHGTSGSEQNLPIGLNAVQDPQGWIQTATGNPVQPASSACSGCHVSKGESAHFLANTDVLGESCNVCHAAGAQFGVDAVHAQ